MKNNVCRALFIGVGLSLAMFSSAYSLSGTVCSMEARLCADGKVMQRNSATCEWIPSSCGPSIGTGINDGDMDLSGSSSMCVNLRSDLRRGVRNDDVASLQDFLLCLSI